MNEERDFIESILSIIIKTFYSTNTCRLAGFYKEKADLELAVTFPASWLKEKRPEIQVSFAAQRKILVTVIDTIKAKGNRAKIQRFSLYFLHCVQEHMSHQGDRYIDALKAPRAVSSLIPKSLRNLQQAAGAADPGAAIAAAHRALAGRRRIRKRKADTFAGDLFDACRAPSGRLQQPGKVYHSIAKSPDSEVRLPHGKAAADSALQRDSSG